MTTSFDVPEHRAQKEGSLPPPKYYTYSNKHTGHEFREQLVLTYEIGGSPISDYYSPDETDAEELFNVWAARYGETEDGFQRIAWYVTTPGFSRVLEFAPYDPIFESSFLTDFTWPVDDDGQPLNWMTLPVQDLHWRIGQADKGGFIQEATGWKPGAMQDRVYMEMLLSGRA
jgi:hypothetical protein